ncbi:MAG: response regulator transcription factor [Frankia sp.]
MRTAQLNSDLVESHKRIETVRVLLVDDQPIVRVGLRAVLSEQPDIDVVDEARNPRSALSRLDHLRPDVIVLDVDAADETTFAAIEQLAARADGAFAILLVTAQDSGLTAARAIRAGARGCMVLQGRTELLVESVRTVALGGIVLTAPGVRELVRGLKPRLRREEVDARVHELSERERAVLALLAQGRSNAEIARELHLAEATVKKHLSQVLRKLGLRDRLQAGLYAHTAGR